MFTFFKDKTSIKPTCFCQAIALHLSHKATDFVDVSLFTQSK